MPKTFPLDVILEEGDDYETGKREAMVIREIGTNSTQVEKTATLEPVKLVIDGKPLGELLQDLSPLSKINALFVDLLDLGSLFYVVPPETSIVVKGGQTTGLEIRCKGELLKLALGEVLPTHLMARFAAQPNHYLDFEYGYVDWSAGKSFADKEEVEVISVTPKTIERVILNGLVEAKCPNWTRAMHEIGLRFYLDNAPLDYLLEKTAIGGIDLYNTVYPPAEDTDHRGFTLKGFPIAVEGDHTLSIRQRNISGAPITIAATAGNGPYVAAICEYITGV